MPLSLQICFVIGGLLCACYVLIFTYCLHGWTRLKRYTKVHSGVGVSVLIATRNEEKNISKCLNAILAQNYSKTEMEIIVTDDHSEDNTANILSEYVQQGKIKMIRLPENELGKKKAIRAAIEAAAGELILTTDADCSMGPEWVSSMVGGYAASGAGMVSGPVAFRNEDTIFKKMQSLEFMALVSTGAGALHHHVAVLCNGANLAYSKNAFLKAGGFDGIDERASGDDVLLMYKLNGLDARNVVFVKDQDAVVSTEPKGNLKEFIQQRRRWASKGLFAMNLPAGIMAVNVYFFCFYLLFGPVFDRFYYHSGPFYLLLTGFCLILFGIKCLIDFLLLFLTASFFGKARFLLLFLPEQILYLIYVVLTGLRGSWGKYEWKGRQMK